MRKIKEIHEFTPETLQVIHDEMYKIYATLEAVSLALYAVNGEPDSLKKAVTISFAVEGIAERLKELCDNFEIAIDSIF